MIDHHILIRVFFSPDYTAMAGTFKFRVSSENWVTSLLIGSKRVLASGHSHRISRTAVSVSRVEKIVPAISVDKPRSLYEIVLPSQTIPDQLVPIPDNLHAILTQLSCPYPCWNLWIVAIAVILPDKIGVVSGLEDSSIYTPHICLSDQCLSAINVGSKDIL